MRFVIRLQGPGVNPQDGRLYEMRTACPAVLTDPSRDAWDYCPPGPSTLPGLVGNTGLAQCNPKFLNILQDIAKDATDDRFFIASLYTLFITASVTSKGQALIKMLGEFPLDFRGSVSSGKDANCIPWNSVGRSASSRLGKVMEIGDLNSYMAIDLLCDKRDIT
ncbi:hypothetical protein HOY80DRAFT_1086177 [Tuber brumale]|nr:hypothetical protein HOY80DRAFT_1086177 [Tuber brumale]